MVIVIKSIVSLILIGRPIDCVCIVHATRTIMGSASSYIISLGSVIFPYSKHSITRKMLYKFFVKFQQ
jgi:hypothetical protein